MVLADPADIRRGHRQVAHNRASVKRLTNESGGDTNFASGHKCCLGNAKPRVVPLVSFSTWERRQAMIDIDALLNERVLDIETCDHIIVGRG